MIGIHGIRPIILSDAEYHLLGFITAVLACVLLAWQTIRKTPGYAKGRKLNALSICMMGVLSVLLFFIYGISVNLLKGILLADLMLFASVSDIRERKVPNAVSFMIALLGLVSVSGGEMLRNAVAGTAAFCFFFLAAVLSKNKIGGADVKFIAACSFVCGLKEGLASVIIGLLLSVVGTLIRNKKAKIQDQTMPLIPYLSVGFFTAFMIGGI